MNEFALKKLYNRSKEKNLDLIQKLKLLKKYSSSILGIIPIITSCQEEHWYTMPIADKIHEHIKGRSITEIVSGVIQLSETLIKLHEIGISHRDIKPSNIYFYEDRYSLGDFGLVDFPENLSDFTRSNRGLGAIFTIAPEMKRDPKHSDGKKADVFSLTKTLWMFFSGENRGFDGEYNFLDPSHSLRYIGNYKETHLVELHGLLRDSTNNNPNLRPTIKEFNKRLNEWIEIYHDGYKAQASEWNFLNKQLFGSTPPESSVWRSPNKIVDILNIIGTPPVYDTSGNCHVVKPNSLHYEGFNENYRWNYFC